MSYTHIRCVCLQVVLYLVMDPVSQNLNMDMSHPDWRIASDPQCHGAVGVEVTFRRISDWRRRGEQRQGTCALYKPGPGITLSESALRAYDSLDMAPDGQEV